MTAQLTIATFPDEAAAAYMRGKAIADPKNFGNLPAQLKQRAFTVAGIEQIDTLRRIRDAIAKLPEGASWDEAKREIAAEMSPYVAAPQGGRNQVGEAPQGGRNQARAAMARAEFLLRTHGFQAYAVARHQQQMEDIEILPYWKYVTVGDSRVRPGHAALDGKVLRADDPWWRTHYPPWEWGCRCIVEALDEEDARAAGISTSAEMPTPERSGSFAFDASDASADLDMLSKSRDDADMRFFGNMARNCTVYRDDGSSCTMWDHEIEAAMRRTARTLAALTEKDGRERAAVRDFTTGRLIGETVGDENSVKPADAKGATVCTLHTHPNGDNTPSPGDLMMGFSIGSRAEFIAAGKKLRRWVWLKTPEKDDVDRIVEYNRANNSGGVDIESYLKFLRRLESNGYIEMRELT